MSDEVYDMAVGCRVCRGPLVEVLNLGEQCLGGQFPLYEEGDPPRAPLVLCRCTGECGLVQLGHVVRPELMFRDYWYRSSVSMTMKEHLRGLADESVQLLGRKPQRVLDIGCNDNTLLNCFPADSVNLWGIDPSNVKPHPTWTHNIKGFFPGEMPMNVSPFDLIFSVACFYDVNDQLGFAKAVKNLLAPDGLWCVEVADLHCMMSNLGYDSICHEHVAYYSLTTLKQIINLAGMKVVEVSKNSMNGGSLRLYAARMDAQRREDAMWQTTWEEELENFAGRVKNHQHNAGYAVRTLASQGKKVHLLGASTKANTVLQYCGLDWSVIEAASDRDPRKIGRRTPGTRIPIISEEESRARKPDVYVTVLGHFRDELLKREEEFLKGGGSMVFLLPKLEEVRLK